MMIYPDTFEKKTGFDKVRELTKGFCLSEPGKQYVEAMHFMSNMADILLQLNRTEEYRNILLFNKEFPLERFPDIRSVLKKMRVEDAYPEKEEVFELKTVLESARGIYSFFRSENRELYPSLYGLAADIKPYPYIFEQVDRIIDKKGAIKDNASAELRNIRRQAGSLAAEISGRIQSVMKRAQTEGLADKDSSVGVRNGRLVIPVHSSGKRKLKGYIHDESSTGKTTYIEPAEVVEMNNQLRELELAEKREIISILKEFAANIRPYNDELVSLVDVLGKIDFVRAKALFSRDIDAVKPVFRSDPVIIWKKAFHPLLSLSFRKEGRKVVPLDITLDQEQRILVISGPNAGGKSVCLQTVALLQYMIQCGMLVPASENSEFGIFDEIFLDMGDEQSIENDLSTYSSRLINMKFFLKNSGKRSLVLIDEFGSGTEPAAGGAIAESILEQLNRNGVMGVFTTHYANLKHFASSESGILNGAMLFDTGAIQPLFRLETGKPGSSFAFEIARKIGLPEDILQNASKKVGEDYVRFDKHLKDIIRDKYYWDRKRKNIRKVEKRVSEELESYSKELKDIKKERKKIIERAREEADQILSTVNKRIENTIREIRESQAEKNTARAAREKAEELKKWIDSESSSDREISEKLSKAEKREEKLKGFSEEKKKENDNQDKKIEKGDIVKLTDQDITGEVLDISGESILVAFGNMITTVNISRLEKRSEISPSKRAGSGGARTGSLDIRKKRLSFSHEMDVRGMRAEEALRIVDEYINEAIMLGVKTVRILHGKGEGVLRQVIRQHLGTIDLVKKYGDEDIERGGAGVTIVELE